MNQYQRALPTSHRLGSRSALDGTPRITRRAANIDCLDWLICFTSLTMLLLSYSTLFQGGQQIVIILFMAPWAIILMRQPYRAFLSIIIHWFLLLLPLLTLISVMWSDYPAATLKLGLEYLSTTMIGILAASCIKPRIAISALMSALSVGVILSFLVASDHNIGIFGSKNYFALCISLLMLTAITVAFDNSQPRFFRIMGFFAFVLSPPELVFAQSMGALVDTSVALAMFFGLRAASRLHPGIRSLAFAIIFFFGIVVLFLGTQYLSSSDVLGLVGKDATLTGRTFIWQHALDSISEHPILGLGYGAFWQVGSWSAEQVWKFMHIPNKMGFHFHDTYFQVAVDLGVVGLAVFVSTLVVLMLRTVAVICSASPTAEQWFAINMFTFFLLRSPIEVDLFFAFNIPSILICMVWVYLPPLRFRRTLSTFEHKLLSRAAEDARALDPLRRSA
jgi:exopolysaccharide production protein ExoQ